ncbi:uncharacterized protein LOC112682521 [Sipha flava]|uniref:Uncharacterized protein LOC112682521 n=1 Tax=Sipha flava TaxID=143950 RepID=A0A2S2Q2X1_9HEMI|nr:uncharacterized protein LOC112682521 [Sipha flava]
MSTDDEERHHPLRDTMFTWMSFMLSVVSIPAFCFCYLTTSIGRFVLLRILKSKFPELEFIKSVSIRSAMDTPSNTGYIVVLLKVNGDFNVDLMRHTIQTDIVDKYDRTSGRLCFPHLRCCLTKKWMRYAWTKPSKNFSIDNHVIELVGKNTVTEDDIMQRVNEVITEGIPAELPQWQITVIPVDEGDTFYMLVRIHHLYASEDGIGLSELLLLKPDDLNWKQPGGGGGGGGGEDDDDDDRP